MSDGGNPDDWDDDWPEGDLAEDGPVGTDADFSDDVVVDASPGGNNRNLGDEPDEAFGRLAEAVSANGQLEAFLDGRLPCVLVHKSHQFSDRLPEVVRYARRQARSRCLVGLVVPFRQPREAVRAFMAGFPLTAVRFADPEIHLHPDHYGGVLASSAQNWPHFGAPIGGPSDAAWSAQQLLLQAQAGATVLLTPTGKVEESNAAASLTDAMRRVATARSVVGTAPMFANLTFDNRWLARQDLRDRLLDEIVDSNERHWYLRFRWPIVEPAYGQLADQQILDGYKELTTVCSDENKVVVFPQSDMTGWTMTALGAAGFGTATSRGDRQFADQRVIASRPGQTRPEPKKRYFSRSVLHTLEQPTHEALLTEPGYRRCRCRWCRALHPDRTAPPTWDRRLVGYHHVQKTVMLTAALDGDRRRQARRRVRTAERFVNGLPAPLELTGDDRPRHLPTWSRLLA